jgi:hypothetical protein
MVWCMLASINKQKKMRDNGYIQYMRLASSACRTKQIQENYCLALVHTRQCTWVRIYITWLLDSVCYRKKICVVTS